MTKIKKYQQGAIIDEDDLFEDDEVATGDAGGALDGELVEGTPPGAGDGEDEAARAAADEAAAAAAELEAAGGDGAPEPPAPAFAELTGVENFLTNYGVQGGIITYEDGTTARFSELGNDEQNEILSSLVKESVPSIEEKFNLDEDEINLLNAVRGSDLSSEEFINSIVDHRLQTVLANRDADNTDYENLSQDAIFVKNLKDNDADITEEAIAEELVKAKDLTSYKSTVESMRKLYISEQTAEYNATQAERDALFNSEIEAQRHDIVQSIETIDDIGGAAVTQEMKEFLLHDMMELNEDKDPILMEKIFSNPQTMFEVNWFMNYGKDYMQQVNNYWKKEVSKAHKTGYEQATGRMPGNPTIIGENGKPIPVTGDPVPDGLPGSFGKVISEEELFEEQ